MRVHFKALESYSTGSTASQAAVANRVELIQMLFDGLIDSLSAARGHIQHKAIEEKSKSLARAGPICVGLQAGPDPGKGGELGKPLNEFERLVPRHVLACHHLHET